MTNLKINIDAESVMVDRLAKGRRELKLRAMCVIFDLSNKELCKER